MYDFISELGLSKQKRFAYYLIAAAANAVLLIPVMQYWQEASTIPLFVSGVCALLAYSLSFAPTSLFGDSYKETGFWGGSNAAAFLAAALYVKGTVSLLIVLSFAALSVLIAAIIISLIPKREVNETTAIQP